MLLWRYFAVALVVLCDCLLASSEEDTLRYAFVFAVKRGDLVPEIVNESPP